jgi:hypothetical protein
MATWRTPSTHVDGEVLDITNWNIVANNQTFLYQMPYGMYYNSFRTVCPTGSTTQLSLGGISAANYGFFKNGNFVVVPQAGLYAVMFSVGVTTSTGTAGTNAAIWSYVYQNRTPVIKGATVPSFVAGPTSGGSGILQCNKFDLISLNLGNLSGSSLQTNADPDVTRLHIVYLGSN